MTDTYDVVHQIEYRWVQVKDMSPIASSMPPGQAAGLDPLIRAWVRHPNVDAPKESVCYQVLSPTMVALAWRYQDPEVAWRKGKPVGRPLVSRVLVGPPTLLPPDLAVLLCRTGLPDLVGPRPGEVGPDEILPAIDGKLKDLIDVKPGELDRSAAQEKGLPQVVAAALSDPNTPIGIHLRDPYVEYPLRTAPQSLLLWGMWRIVGPLLGPGTAPRGWSFSTFELPMGEQDTSALPDIVFRRAQAASGPPTNARQEIRVRPGDSSASTPLAPEFAKLADWLVAEYHETGGDQLARLITKSGAHRSREERLGILFKTLGAKRSAPGPATFVAGSPSQGMPAAADLNQITTPSGYPGPAEDHAASRREEKRDYWDEDAPQDTAGPRAAIQPQKVGYDWASHRPPNASGNASGPSRPDAFDDQDPRYHAASAPFPPGHGVPPADTSSRRDTSTGPGTSSRSAEPQPTGSPASEPSDVRRDRRGRVYPVPALFDGLETESDSRRFQLVLDDLLATTTEFDDRAAARRRMPRQDWYIPTLQRHGYDCVPVLADIFQAFVVPDLEKANVAGTLGEWVLKGPPQVTAALLTAAKAADEDQRSGGGTFPLMTYALGEAGLQKLLEVSDIPFDWPRPRRGAKAHRRQAGDGSLARVLHFLGFGLQGN